MDWGPLPLLVIVVQRAQQHLWAPQKYRVLYSATNLLNQSALIKTLRDPNMLWILTFITQDESQVSLELRSGRQPVSHRLPHGSLSFFFFDVSYSHGQKRDLKNK